MFNTGDIIVVTRDNSAENNLLGRIGRFISYYPTVLKEEEISNLHAAIVELAWQTDDGIVMNRVLIMPDQLTKISYDKYLLLREFFTAVPELPGCNPENPE